MWVQRVPISWHRQLPNAAIDITSWQWSAHLSWGCLTTDADVAATINTDIWWGKFRRQDSRTVWENKMCGPKQTVVFVLMFGGNLLRPSTPPHPPVHPLPIPVSAVKLVHVWNAGPVDNKTVPFAATWQLVSSFFWSTVVKVSRKSRHWHAGMKCKHLSVCCEVSGNKKKKKKGKKKLCGRLSRWPTSLQPVAFFSPAGLPASPHPCLPPCCSNRTLTAS